MAATFNGLTASRGPGEIRQMRVNTNSLKEGAVVIFDTAQIKGSAKAPTAAGNIPIAGVLVDVLTSDGTVSGSSYNVQYTGKCFVLLGNGEAVNAGDRLIINDTDGSVKAIGTTDSCGVLGTALQTLTAGAANEMIEVELGIYFSGDTVP
jgi:hypothetical protein